MVEVNKTLYLGIDAYEITNGTVSLIVLSGVGPRIISFGFKKKDNNVLRVSTDDFFDGGDGYKFYGGHRLWHSPEHPVKCYYPDNEPCETEVLELGVKVTKTEKENGIKSSMQIEMKENGRVRIIHTLENISDEDVEMASWGITQLKTGGVAVIPQVTKKTGLLPNRSIALWDYTDLSDKRLSFSRSFVFVKQLPEIKDAMKIGLYNSEGIAYYYVDGDLFTKEFDVFEGEHGDFGSNFEVYVNGDFIELETLSSMKNVIKGGGFVEHTEVWSLTEKVDMPDLTVLEEDKECVHA